LRSDDGENRKHEGRRKDLLVPIKAQARLCSFNGNDSAGNQQELA
jgi:hypothetical protein